MNKNFNITCIFLASLIALNEYRETMENNLITLVNINIQFYFWK